MGIKIEEKKDSICIKSQRTKMEQTSGKWLSNDDRELFVKSISSDVIGSGSQMTSSFPNNYPPYALLNTVRSTLDRKYNVEGKVEDGEKDYPYFDRPCFILIYQYLTGQKSLHFESRNPIHTHTFASFITMLFRQGNDSDGEKLQLAILYALIRNPWICQAGIMPKYKGSTQYSYWSTEVEYSGDPKKDSFSKLIHEATEKLAQIKEEGYLLEEEGGEKMFVNLAQGLPKTGFISSFEDSARSHIQPKAQAPIVPIPNSAEMFQLKLIYFTEPSGRQTVTWKSCLKGLTERTNEGTSVSNYLRSELSFKGQEIVKPQQLDDLLNNLLRKVSKEIIVSAHSDFVDSKPIIPNTDLSLPTILKKHPNANSLLAEEMLSRLDNDVTDFENEKKKELRQKPTMSKLTDLHKFLDSNDISDVKKQEKTFQNAEVVVKKIRERLLRFREKDIQKIVKEEHDRNLIIDSKGSSQDRFLLLRNSGHETTVWFELIVSALISNVGCKDLRKLNPFVTEEEWDKYLSNVAINLLRTNRIDVINSTIRDTDEVIKVLVNIREKKCNLDDEILNLRLKLDVLCTQLTIKRVYSEEDKIDPRFLVFEFLSGIVLRKRQVELVRECVEKAETDQSVVKQMIMGAGKTAVVSPLICLLLAHGDHIVTQCVPTELLATSTSIMRKTFSTIISKSVYSFFCDRSTIANSSMQAKLMNAQKTGGIIMTTPGSIKSLILNFVEGLSSKRDSSSKLFESLELNNEIKIWSEIIRIFSDGVCIMDEVDMILHPLKSELNFPIGKKDQLDFSEDGERWQLPMAVLDVILFAGKHALEQTRVHAEDVPVRLKIGNQDQTQEFLDLLVGIIMYGLKNNKLQKNPTQDKTGFVLLQEGFYTDLISRQELRNIIDELQSTSPIVGRRHVFNEEGDISFKSLMIKFYTYYLKRVDVPMEFEDVEKYLLHRSESYRIDELKENTKRCSKDDLKHINLAHDWIHVYIPHALKKIDRVTFGLLSESDIQAGLKTGQFISPSRQKLAIPFISKDVPAPTSEFAQPDVVIGLTYLGYRYEGMRYNDFIEMVSRLQSDFSQETGPFERRPTNEMWVDWIKLATERLNVKLESNPIFQASLKEVDRSDDSHMRPLFELLKSNAESIYWFLNDLVFANLMKFQETKLSASGQDMGGAILFKRCIGFSGTASELLPQELLPKEGDKLFERFSEGRILDTLTSRDIVSCRKLSNDWSPKSILDMIAENTPREYHALIDTGALITGFSNLGVAEYLLRSIDCLKGFDGVVYLDENDQKMILTRDKKSLRLGDCNIAKDKYFVFYDQMHTTGMDIKHRLRARAALTLGKDMTWRDYQQGAYRMRGIGKGQTIELLVSPQVASLINDDFASFPVESLSIEEEKSIKGLNETNISSNAPISPKMVAVWQILQQIRSERLQYAMLQQQNLANLWRKPAFLELRNNYSVALQKRCKNGCSEGSSKDDNMHKYLDLIDQAINAFLEDVSMPVQSEVPSVMSLEEMVQKMKKNQEHWLCTKAANDAIDILMGKIKGLKQCHGINCAMERELQKEEEKELEQETEMERFVDLAYKRDNLDPTPWQFDDIRMTDGFDAFYPASQFKIHGKGLKMPVCVDGTEDLQFSRNYFDPRWSGLRRLRNICILLEYVPNQQQLEFSSDHIVSLKPDVQESLERTLNRIYRSISENGTDINRDALQMILEEYLGCKLDRTVIDKSVAVLDQSMVNLKNRSRLNLGKDQVKEILLGHGYQKQDDRRFTVISLAEAETIRRIIHARNEEDKDIIDGWGTTIALHSISHGGMLMDTSRGYRSGSRQQKSHILQLARFFDGEMKFDRTELMQLLHMLQLNNIDARKDFFVRMTACRRRFNGKWQERSVAAVLNDFNDEFVMLRRNIEGRLLKFAIESHSDYEGKNFEEVFNNFDESGDRVLQISEVIIAMEILGMSYNIEDIAELHFFADKNQDGVISKREFLYFLSGYNYDMQEEHLKPRHFVQRSVEDIKLLTVERKKESRQIEDEVKEMKQKFIEVRKKNSLTNDKTIQQMKDSSAQDDDRCVSNPIWDKGQWDENSGKGHAEWDFNTPPIFVEIKPNHDACVPCAEKGDYYKDRCYQVVKREGSMHVKMANILRDHVTLHSWSLTLFMRLETLPDEACPLFTLERSDDNDGDPGASLCVDRSGELILIVGRQPLKPANIHFPDITVKGNVWNLISMVVEEPKMETNELRISIYLNCEIISSFKIPLDYEKCKIPFDLDVAAGVKLFGNNLQKSSSNCKKNIRKMWVSPFALEDLDVFSLHVALGCWRCQSSKCPKKVPNTLPNECKYNLKGMRNAPDAKKCCLCNEKRPPSQVPPTKNPPPDHPGLFIVTSTTFEEEVLDSSYDVFLMVSADWCPASRKLKPEWYKLANLLRDSKDIRIAYFDSDENQSDPKYIWEGSIPNMKFFVRKRDSEGNIEEGLNNKERPIRFEENSRTLRSLLTFMDRHTKGNKNGGSMVDAHYEVYGEEHGLPRKFHEMFLYFELAISQQKEEREKDYMLRNAERWLALYCDDPLTMAAGISKSTKCLVEDERYPKSMEELGEMWRDQETINSLLKTMNQELKLELPSDPLSFLSRYLEDSCRVSVCTKLDNAPKMFKDLYIKHKHEVHWDIYDGSEKMDEREEQKAWSELIDKMHAVCSATSGALHEQAIERLSNIIRQLSGEGYNLDASPFGPSLAWVCAGMGMHSKLLNRLWWSGANIQKRSRSDGTLPIEVAAAMGNIQTVEQLYRMGCSIGRASHFAVSESQLGILELLFTPKGKKVKSGESFGLGLSPNRRIAGIAPLELAVITSNTPVTQFLLSFSGLQLIRDLSPQVREVYRLTEKSNILHLCAHLGGSREKIIKEIIDKDKSIIIQKDQQGRRPRDLCMHANILAALSDTSTSDSCWDIIYDFINSTDWSEEKREGMIERLKTSIQKGSDPSARNGVGWTPLMILALICEYKAIEIILDSRNLVLDGCDNSTKKESTLDRKSVAAKNKQTEAEKILYMTSNSGLTALMWAEWMDWVMMELKKLKQDEQITNQELLEKIPFDFHGLDINYSSGAQKIVREFAKRGATLRRKDEQGLELLRKKFSRAIQDKDMVTISLLLFNPRDLKVCRKSFDSNSDLKSKETDGLSDAFKDRINELRTMNGSEVKEFVPDSYEPEDSLETFLIALDKSKLKDGKLWAPAFQGSMKSLIVSSKLFVLDCIASGKSSLPAEDIFALHTYTLQSSIYSEVNASMREINEEKIKFWRPYIFFLSRALRRLNVEGAIVLRGIKLNFDKKNNGTVGKFLDGMYGNAEQDINAMYHPGRVVLWPAFSSSSLNRHIALGYSTINLEEEDAAVIFKIYSRSARSISKYSFYPFEEELLFGANTVFRVEGLWEPTLFNLQEQGGASLHLNNTHGSTSLSSFKTDNTFLQTKKLTMEEARTRKIVVISIVEQPETIGKIRLGGGHGMNQLSSLAKNSRSGMKQKSLLMDEKEAEIEHDQETKRSLRAKIAELQSQLDQMQMLPKATSRSNANTTSDSAPSQYVSHNSSSLFCGCVPSWHHWKK